MAIVRLHVAVLALMAATPVAAQSLPQVEHRSPVVTASPAFAPVDFVQLRISGRLLAWPQSGHGNLKLTWSLANAAVATEGVTNCGRMAPLYGIGKFDRPHILQEIEAAFGDWQKAAAVEFEYIDDPAKALVLIGAMESPQGIAFADVQYTPAQDLLHGQIVRGLVCINTQARWKSGFDGDLKSYDIRFVLTHEIGHVLGLDHPSSTGHLMSWRYDERTRGLQAGDIGGIVSLYGLRRRLDAERR